MYLNFRNCLEYMYIVISIFLDLVLLIHNIEYLQIDFSKNG